MKSRIASPNPNSPNSQFGFTLIELVVIAIRSGLIPQALGGSMRFCVLVLLCAGAAGLAQPVIKDQPRTQFQWENRRVGLTVAAASIAPLTYQWQFNGTDIPDATNRSYAMQRVQLTNEGHYRLLVTDTSGTATSQVGRVMVRAWPKPTGPFIPELARLDTNIMAIMLGHSVPGGSLAVVKDGRLIMARGYGFADVENNEAFQPDSSCRVASMSKTITAAIAMKLVEEGKLDLDAPVLPILRLEPPDYPGANFDSRWTNVTLRHCLNHTGGWDRDTALDPLGVLSFDATFWPDRVAQDLKLQVAAAPADMVRWMLGRPMQSKPGTAFAYNNFGYEVAGTLIEKAAGVPYEAAARALLSKSGITRMRVGGNGRADRRLGEASYYLHPSITPAWARSLSEPKPFDFELPYAWPVSFYPASGGWTASVIDYARLIASIDGDPSYPDVLSTSTIATMLARPAGSSGESHYGLGVEVTPGTGLREHRGGDVGWRSHWVRTKSGLIVVFTMNTRWDYNIWSTLSPILDGIRQWPAHDLFPNTLSYEAWGIKHFGGQGATAFEDGSDPDRDGVPNIIEYSQGTDPLAASPRPPLTVAAERVDGRLALSISFRRLLLEHEIDYSLEASGDLASWSLVSSEPPETALNTDGTVTAKTRIIIPETDRVRFFRLLVARKVGL